MSSTIEKALQRRREAMAAEKAKNQSADSAEQQAAPQAPAAKRSHVPAARPQGPTSQLEPFNIDLDRLERNGHVSLSGVRKGINEEYREIKRKLLANAFGPLSSTIKNSNIIMVTSGRPSEGKTFTATNLALSIASEQDKTVLLVDADVLKPNVLNTFGVERRSGLMEYLTGEVNDIADVLYPTNIDKLKIIPAGKTHHLSTELLASQKMHETVDEFANRYPDRIVIIDTPPLIGITESAILANFAGQAVVVTEEGRSKLSDIRLSVERLNPDMAIGFVVNKVVNKDANDPGYYGYYYGQEQETANGA
ncbi:polysaccharide biosynthesis tyrosine autokinase [Salinimonas sp. HHU 13199]|uniref:non-specific protein-tyrosine kinase n=1 Tax=Salinimonas profundi TaxID=2729140 RepID=A0ABR8LNW7_9ALTE|nr:XrtA-associated tyrosine autokinase [Salinimonas profundi]MBD3586616.1 polysaccharide biosynthesis tyrosine autokinase [Salinimonas profundi]